MKLGADAKIIRKSFETKPTIPDDLWIGVPFSNTYLIVNTGLDVNQDQKEAL